MTNYSGFWFGQIHDLHASIIIGIPSDAGDDPSIASLFSGSNDQRLQFSGHGSATEDGGFRIELHPSTPTEGGGVTPLTVTLVEQPDGSANGVLQNRDGRSFNFAAYRQPQTGFPSQQLAPNIPGSYFSQEKQTRAPACAIDLATLKQIYYNLLTAAVEAARLEASRNVGQFDSREERLRQLYSVSVNARGWDGDVLVAFDGSILTEERLPQPLRKIEFQIGLLYRFANNNQNPPNQARVVLDFSKPPLVDFTNPSGGPTPNESELDVRGNDSIWVSGTYEKVQSILRRRSVKTGWLHWRHTYDVLLFVLGFPLAFLFAAYATQTLAASVIGASSWLGLALFLFFQIAGLLLFRAGFSFSRWLLPYMEFSAVPAPVHRQLRLVFATLLLGALGSLAASMLWTVFSEWTRSGS